LYTGRAAPCLSIQSVKSMLMRGLDRQALPELVTRPPVEHANIRGAEYYSLTGSVEEVAG